MVVVLPVPVVVILPGVLVTDQLLGKPLKATLPVVVVHVGCVMVPMVGAVGLAVTVKETVLEHPVAESVKVRVVVPAATPVTTPALVTVATPGALLAQVPPVAGVTLAVLPTQTVVAPPKVGLAGIAFTTTFALANEVHPVVVLVTV